MKKHQSCSEERNKVTGGKNHTRHLKQRICAFVQQKSLSKIRVKNENASKLDLCLELTQSATHSVSCMYLAQHEPESIQIAVVLVEALAVYCIHSQEVIVIHRRLIADQLELISNKAVTHCWSWPESTKPTYRLTSGCNTNIKLP